MSELWLSKQIADPTSELVLEALTRRCDQCMAPVGELCSKRGGLHRDLLGRVIHIGRMVKA